MFIQRKINNASKQKPTEYFKRRKNGSEDTAIQPMQLNPNAQHNQHEYVATIFDRLNPDCMNELLDWIDFNSLCSFSKTCHSLQKCSKEYFQWKYPSLEFTVGDEFIFNAKHVNCFGFDVQELRVFDSSIDNFIFAGLNINKSLREIEFDTTMKDDNEITKEHIECLTNILENVKVVRAVQCKFERGCIESLLKCCKNIESLAFTIHKDLRQNRFIFSHYPTLRNIEIDFHPKANVVNAINILKEQNVQLNEFVLSFHKEHNDSLKLVFDELDLMYEKKFYRHLYLTFEKKSMVTDHIDRITSIQGLDGLCCSYTIDTVMDNHIDVLSKLQNLKYLNINWLLNGADQIAQQLQRLEELSITVASIDAIYSFVRYSINLSSVHIDQIRTKNQCNVKFNANNLNKRRSSLVYARKLIIYVPEKNFIKLKWSSGPMNYDLVEIKRYESYVPKYLYRKQTNG